MGRWKSHRALKKHGLSRAGSGPLSLAQRAGPRSNEQLTATRVLQWDIFFMFICTS